MATLECTKHINVFVTDTINGYLRRIQSSFPVDSIYYNNIPSLVSYWCVLFFYVKECFDPDACDSHYILSDDNTLVEKKPYSSDAGNVFLFNTASHGVHKWKFKLRIGNMFDSTMTIGVWKINHLLDTTQALYDIWYKGKFYGWRVNNGTITHGDDEQRYKYTNHTKQNNDVIEMILDLNKRELRFICNDKDFGAAFKQIEDSSYRAAVSFYSKDYAIELLDYSAH